MSSNGARDGTRNARSVMNAEPNESDIAEAGCSSESPSFKNIPKLQTACDCVNGERQISHILQNASVADTAM